MARTAEWVPPEIYLPVITSSRPVFHAGSAPALPNIIGRPFYAVSALGSRKVGLGKIIIDCLSICHG